MWRKSEEEKSKIKSSRLVLSGAAFSREGANRELMQIDPSLLDDYNGRSLQLGEGVFGRVALKTFRGTPAAVKYFHESSMKMVERETLFLEQCSHLNLSVIFGMNTKTCYPS